VYGEDSTDVSSVGLWIRRFNSGEKNSGNRPCSASAKRFKLPANSFARKSEKNVFEIKQNMWQINLNIVKDVPIVHVNIIKNVVMVSEKKVTGFTFVPPIVLRPTVKTNQ
jgi:hypothetical protein